MKMKCYCGRSICISIESIRIGVSHINPSIQGDCLLEIYLKYNAFQPISDCYELANESHDSFQSSFDVHNRLAQSKYYCPAFDANALNYKSHLYKWVGEDSKYSNFSFSKEYLLNDSSWSKKCIWIAHWQWVLQYQDNEFKQTRVRKNPILNKTTFVKKSCAHAPWISMPFNRESSKLSFLFVSSVEPNSLKIDINN